MKLVFHIFVVAYTLQHVGGAFFGPRGMYCGSINDGHLPALAMYFTPEEIVSAPHPAIIGNFKAYGLSPEGEYSVLDRGKVRYTAVYDGDIRQAGKPVNVSLPSIEVMEKFSTDVGLDSKDILRMRYKDGGSITASTSRGTIELTFEGCQLLFASGTFCTTLPNGGTKLTISALRQGTYPKVFLYINGILSYTGLWFMNTDEIPMNVSLAKAGDKYLDAILNLIPRDKEASYEYFWNRGSALTWDPLRGALTLHYGEGPGEGEYSDVDFTKCSF